MNPELPDDAVEFGATARRAFDSIGGIDAARRAEIDRHGRLAVGELLAQIGADDLGTLDDPDASAAAAVLCAEAGRVVLPFPLPAVLLRVAATEGDPLPFVVVPSRRPRVDHGDLFDQWATTTLDGHQSVSTSLATGLGSELGPFVGDLAADGTAPRAVAADDRRTRWWLTLTSWVILGALERAVELAVEHTTQREQFAKPLTAFQTVRFRLADLAVATRGLRELAAFTLWRLAVASDDAWPDVLALRSHALGTAHEVLRAAQQLHGAAGLCDEYDISIVVRHLQPALRLPEGRDATTRRLVGAIDRDGFDGLFVHGGHA